MLGFLAERSLPFNLAPILAELCQEVSRDPRALNEVSLGRAAAAYKMVHGLGKTMKMEIITDLQRTPFSMNIDEATSKNHLKVLSILVSYLSPVLGRVIHHLESVSMVRVRSQALFDEIVNIMDTNEIPWTNLMSVLMES